MMLVMLMVIDNLIEYDMDDPDDPDDLDILQLSNLMQLCIDLWMNVIIIMRSRIIRIILKIFLRVYMRIC